MVALGMVWAIGCTPMDKVSTTSWLPRRHPFQGPTGPDVVQMRVALLEVRPGEAEWKYVNDDLWQLADESLIDEDRRLVMDESGFRVAKVGTQPPAKLLAMLMSRRFNPTPRDMTFRTGDPKGLIAGPPLPHCRYRSDRDGELMELDQVDCKLLVAASRGPNGRTILRVTPQVIHGDAKAIYRADAQAGTIVSVPERPTETYTPMGWDAELALNEYLIVGGNYERTETLGHQFFVRPDEAQPVQRVLVIQMGAAPPETPLTAPAGEQPGTAPRSAPLAYQTAWPAARGAAP